MYTQIHTEVGYNALQNIQQYIRLHKMLLAYGVANKQRVKIHLHFPHRFMTSSYKY